MGHLKTIAAPLSWPLKRKEKKYILKPSPGAHSLKESVSINFLLIDLLKLSKTKKESTYILCNKNVLVDGSRRKNPAHPVGLFDVISISDLKKHYRMIIDQKGRCGVKEIAAKEKDIKPVKILGKSLVKKKFQLHFSDGGNLLTDKNEYKVGDTIILNVENKSIKEHLSLKKGNSILLTGGKHRGSVGTVENIIGSKIVYKAEKKVFETLKKFAFVIGKDKPYIAL